MSIHQLYRNRLQVAAACAILAVLVTILAAVERSAPFMVPAAMFAAVAIGVFRMARESYRFDLGLSGPPEARRLVREAHAWAENGFRTPEEVAAGIPPRSRPPEPRS